MLSALTPPNTGTEKRMNTGPGVLSAAQMVADDEDDEAEEVNDGRVGGEDPEEGSPVRPQQLALDSGDEDDADDEDDDDDDAAARKEGAAAGGKGAAGGGGGARLTKPKKLAISRLETTSWPTDSLSTHVLLELVTTGGSAPKILSISSRVLLPGTASVPEEQLTFDAFVKVPLVGGKGAALDAVHGVDYAETQRLAMGDFSVVGRCWLEWLKAAVRFEAPCLVCSWGGLKQGIFSLLPLELERHGLRLPPAIMFTDLCVDKTTLKAVAPSASKASDVMELAEAVLQQPGGPNAAPHWLKAAVTPPAPLSGGRGRSRGAKGKAARSAPPPTATALVACLKQQPAALRRCAALSVLLAPVRSAVKSKRVCYDSSVFKEGSRGWKAHLAYEAQQRDDPVLKPWEERTTPPINHGDDGPAFQPRPGCAPKGGPSKHLRDYLQRAAAANKKADAEAAERASTWRSHVEGGSTAEGSGLPRRGAAAAAMRGNRGRRSFRQASIPTSARAEADSEDERDTDSEDERDERDEVLEMDNSDSEVEEPARRRSRAAAQSSGEATTPPRQPRGRKRRRDDNGEEVELGAETHDGFTASEMLVALFEYYFEPELVALLVEATNRKAREKVVKIGRGRFRLATNADAKKDVRERAKEWIDVTLEEMYVFLGIRIVMGAHHRDRVTHYWNKGQDSDGFRVALIADAMKKDRHLDILSYLSFALPDDTTTFAGNKLAKLKRVNDWLRDNTERGWDIEPDATLDESRLRLHSRFCSFVTEMICKPIKTGCTIYCVNFSRSGYLYTWEWFTGSKHDRPQGQPTDTTPIDEDNEQHTGYVLPLCLRLIRPAFDKTFCTIYFDKAFTTIKLARQLAERGVGLVGMMRAARPKVMTRGPEHYWPFRKYAKSECEEITRGWARRAYCKLPTAHGRSWWMGAETWLDSTFVTLLSTAWFSSAAETVQRRVKQLPGVKTTLSCSRQLARYCKMLGGVDRFNKMLVATHMGVGRCKQRYQRALFLGWLLPAAGMVNVRTAFNHLWPEAMSGDLQERHKYFGYDKWVQLRLGEALIMKYVKKAKALSGTPRKTLRTQAAPHFMPHKPGTKAKPSALAGLPLPSSHKCVDVTKRVLKGADGKRIKKGRCELCKEIAKRGKLVITAPSGRGKKAHSKERELPGGGGPGQTQWACAVCKVRLCKDGTKCKGGKRMCFSTWCHEDNCAPTQRVLVL